MHSSNSAHTPPVTSTATQFRASVFHPTRTGGSSITGLATNVPEALTFRHIFGRGTLLTNETGAFEDLTPLSNTGTSVTTTSVLANAAYTNGKYTITDPNGLKQKVKKFNAATAPTPPNNVATQYTNWGVKVVSMSASITSLKVIWKHVRSPCASPLTRYCFLTFCNADVCPCCSARSNTERSQIGFGANPAAAPHVSQRKLNIPT